MASASAGAGGNGTCAAEVAAGVAAALAGAARGGAEPCGRRGAVEEEFALIEGDGVFETEESLASFSILFMILLLLGASLVGYFLQRRRVRLLGEAGFALLLGVLAGFLVYAFNGFSRERTHYITFQKEFFFLFLLPPIIFEAGFGVEVGPFFRNFGAICVFAFLGTAVSTFAVGGIMYGAGQAGLSYGMPMLECMLFGSLISATDPVTVLAVFQSLKVEINMYSLVFGESVMNDAVAIVLYRSLLTFKTEPVSASSIAGALGLFLVIFVGSFLIGGAVGLLSALLFKNGSFRRLTETDRDSVLEAALVVCVPYIAYMLAEGLQLSGIVSILFCGIVMKRYTNENLSHHARETCHSFFKIAASLAETFIFLYMGVEVFLADQRWNHMLFFFWALLAILVARALNVFLGSFLVNLSRPRSFKISRNYQKMLWFSGLRGGIAFALALGSGEDIGEEDAKTILNATLLIVLLTVLGIGGFTTHALEHYKIQIGRGGSARSSSDLQKYQVLEEDGPGTRRAEGGGGRGRSGSVRAPVTPGTFAAFERKYVLPFFTGDAGYDRGRDGHGMELPEYKAQENGDGGARGEVTYEGGGEGRNGDGGGDVVTTEAMEGSP